MTEHLELREGRQQLFIPFKDNNAGKELSPATISRWICNTMVESHAALEKSKSLSRTVKAHEVLAVCQGGFAECNEGQHVVKWSTFTSFCLRDLCSQADCLHKAGSL